MTFDTLTPDQRTQLMSMMSRLGGNQMPMPGMQQGQPMPQMPQGQPQMPRMGPQGSVLPTGSAVPNVGGVRPSAMPARQPSAISGHGALGMVFGGIMMAKQKMSQDKQQKARAIAGQYIAITNGGGDTSQFLQDPKVHKIFDKALKDPNSPEAQGIQQAYQDVQRQDQMKQQMELAKAQIDATIQYRKAQEEQARATANWRDTQAGTIGQVTDRDKYLEGQKNQRASQAIQAKLEISSNGIKAAGQRAEAKIKSLEGIASKLEAGRNARAAASEAGKDKRAGQRLAQTQSAVKDIMKQYSNVRSEISNLEKEQATAEKNAKGIEAWVTGDADMYNAQAQGIQAQLDKQKALLDQYDAGFNAMIASGAVSAPAVSTTPTAGGGAASSGASKPKIIVMDK